MHACTHARTHTHTHTHTQDRTSKTQGTANLKKKIINNIHCISPIPTKGFTNEDKLALSVCWTTLSVQAEIEIYCVVDHFYIALFSVSSKLTALLSHVTLNEWLGFLQRALNIHPSGIVAVLLGSYMADATQNCYHLGAFCVHHTTMHHITSLHAHTYYSVHACLAVISHLHFLCAFLFLFKWAAFFTCYCGSTLRSRCVRDR